MIKFILGMVTGAFLGVTWMCLAAIVDDVDELTDDWSEGLDEEPKEYCPNCGCDLSATVYIEDNCIYTRVNHCPKCGMPIATIAKYKEKEEETDDEHLY